jgi:protein-tyrosine phosphatase
MLKRAFGGAAGIRSAGTGAKKGDGISEPMRELLTADGLDGSAHKARQLTPALARHADVIIAMTAVHRTTIVRAETSAIHKTFLLSELASAAEHCAPLTGATRGERLAGIPAAIIAFRPELSGLVARDVPDPYGRGPDIYQESYAMIKEAVLAIDRWVTQGT